jgi:heptosyltransferase-1
VRVLVVKTSSLGDVVHTFPALTDARRALPQARFDWAVEPAYAPVAALHPAVAAVVPVGLRVLARRPAKLGEVWRAARAVRYDRIVDAQGLAKALLVTRLARGERHGYDRASVREPLASAFYDVRHSVPRDLHAIERTRRLFAAALGYPAPQSAPDYGLPAPADRPGRSVVLVHGAAWGTKLWGAEAWREVALRASAAGYEVLVPAHGPEETRRASEIVADVPRASVLPPQDLGALARRLGAAAGAIAADTGLAHLTAALGRAVVTLYGPTAPGLTGAVGRGAVNLAAPESCPHAPCRARSCRLAPGAASPPCLAAFAPERVWRAFVALDEPAAPKA